jgi:hypothetical protein
MYPATDKDIKRARNGSNIAFIIDHEKVTAEHHPEYEGFQGRTRAFMGDIPPDAIVGLVVGETVAADQAAVAGLSEIFPGVAQFDAHSQRIE